MYLLVYIVNYARHSGDEKMCFFLASSVNLRAECLYLYSEEENDAALQEKESYKPISSVWVK